MGRKKKGIKLKSWIIIAVLIITGWFGYSIFRDLPRESTKPAAEQSNLPDDKTTAGDTAESKETAKNSESQFVLETYRNDRYGFELQYPVLKDDGGQCPKLAETENGFDLGIFSFAVYDANGKTLAEFIGDELAGMNIETRTATAVAGAPAARIDYQTAGMGFNGSSVYLEHNGKFFEFGMLVNTAPSSCGGVTGYEDNVYQSVISSLKFTK